MHPPPTTIWCFFFIIITCNTLYDMLHNIAAGTTSTPSHTSQGPLAETAPKPATTSCAVSVKNQSEKEIKNMCRTFAFLIYVSTHWYQCWPPNPLQTSSQPLPLHKQVQQLSSIEAAVGLQPQRRGLLVSRLLQVHQWDFLNVRTSAHHVK